MPTLLVVDRDQQTQQCFRYATPPEQMSLLTAGTAEAALALFAEHGPDVVVSDMQLPDASGLELMQRLQELDARVPVIVMTGHGSSSTAIDAMRCGAYDYLLKPLDPDSLQQVLDRAMETSRMFRTAIKIAGDGPVEVDDDEVLVGQCPAMQEVYRQIGRVAPQDVTVLILGESGTGKEVVARAIYQYSQRAARPFVAINCAAIPEHLLESELFGHEKGSFTGADRLRIGKFEQCDGGTLFLDEIGDMTPLTQTKVLRVLQEQRFERVGGNRLVTTNVRLIAATNRNLSEMQAQGTFRSDLFYRLNVYAIHLPPLRERIGDLPLLIRHFLTKFTRELHKEVQHVSPQALRLLVDYPWPGNIRELQSALKHAVIESTGPAILPESLPESLRHYGDAADTLRQQSPPPAPRDKELLGFIRNRVCNGTRQLYGEVLHRVEHTLFTELLEQVDGNLSRAAAILGITRATLRAKLAASGINVVRSVHID